MRSQKIRHIFAVAIATICIAGCKNSDEFRFLELPSWSPSALPKLAILDDVPTLFGPSTTYEGLWLSEFETQYFVEGLKKHKRRYDDNDLDTWIYPRTDGFLVPEDSAKLDYSHDDGNYPAQVAVVKFVGRRNLMPSFYGFGHLGTCSRAIVVEKVIAIEAVGI